MNLCNMKTKILPRGKQVLIKPISEESRISENGLIIPSNIEQERKSIGTVLEIGSEIKDIKKGDKVIFGTYAGEKIKVKEGNKEVDYIILFDDDILAFIKD